MARVKLAEELDTVSKKLIKMDYPNWRAYMGDSLSHLDDPLGVRPYAKDRWVCQFTPQGKITCFCGQGESKDLLQNFFLNIYGLYLAYMHVSSNVATNVLAE